jgi:hypothetical protein
MDDDRSRDRNGRKNRRIDLFVAALLVNANVEQAAAAAKISSASSWRYPRDPEVLTRLRAACRHTMQESKALLQAASIEAVSLLRQVLRECESQSTQVAAARTVLEMALRAVELDDVEQRLSKLEEIAKSRWKGLGNDREDQTSTGKNRGVNGPA